jgi:UDP-glucuronate 4-epimerase
VLVTGAAGFIGSSLVDRLVTVLEVVTQLEQALGVDAEIAWQPRETGDVTRRLADASAARAALGWSPRVSFEEGIRRFAGWLQASR